MQEMRKEILRSEREEGMKSGMRITCNCCKEEVEVALYFYNQEIAVVDYFPSAEKGYRAATSAKAICPCCGVEINKRFASEISSNDIVQLAIGKGGAE